MNELRTTTRRSFLGTAAGLSGAALATGAWRPVAEPRAHSAMRTSTASRFALELDGTTAFVRSVEGGAIRADVIGEPQGSTYYQKKHIASPTYEDIELQVGLSMGTPLYDWVNSSWTGTYARKSGAILVGDQKGDAKERREFEQALITETGFPVLDAATKQAGEITVKIAAEVIRYKPASGGIVGLQSQKTWMSSNFKFEVQGVNATHVTRIDPFSVSVDLTEDPVGELRDLDRSPARTVFGDLVVSVAESGAADWTKWFDDFVIKGNADEDKEKQALLSLLATDLKQVLAHVHFFNVGIFRYADAPDDGTSTLRRRQAHLYYERAAFHIGPVESGPGDGVCAKCGG